MDAGNGRASRASKQTRQQQHWQGLRNMHCFGMVRLIFVPHRVGVKDSCEVIFLNFSEIFEAWRSLRNVLGLCELSLTAVCGVMCRLVFLLVNNSQCETSLL